MRESLLGRGRGAQELHLRNSAARFGLGAEKCCCGGDWMEGVELVRPAGNIERPQRGTVPLRGACRRVERKRATHVFRFHQDGGHATCLWAACARPKWSRSFHDAGAATCRIGRGAGGGPRESGGVDSGAAITPSWPTRAFPFSSESAWHAPSGASCRASRLVDDGPARSCVGLLVRHSGA